MRITTRIHDAYRLFIDTHCPRKDGEIILCKNCKHYEGRCWHESHPKRPLFER